MRTIDGMMSICNKEKMDLTIIWVMDNSLNCSFFDLFKPFNCDGFNVLVVDCPTGYPEIFCKPKGKGKLRSQVKNSIRKKFLTDEQKEIIKILKELKDENKMTQTEFGEIYASDDKRSVNSIREMDEIFISKIETPIQQLINKPSVKYIATCYRLYPLEDKYTLFKPITFIEDKVSESVQKYHGAIGLHIRRSDHETAKGYSTTDKFTKLIDKHLSLSSETNFFLSTDNDETGAELKNLYGEKILVNEVSSYDRNQPEAVQEALIDLLCLSNTKLIYGSHHSSFSQTAADIGEIEEITAM